jgi:hypothetical protein
MKFGWSWRRNWGLSELVPPVFIGGCRGRVPGLPGRGCRGNPARGWDRSRSRDFGDLAGFDGGDYGSTKKDSSWTTCIPKRLRSASKSDFDSEEAQNPCVCHPLRGRGGFRGFGSRGGKSWLPSASPSGSTRNRWVASQRDPSQAVAVGGFLEAEDNP